MLAHHFAGAKQAPVRRRDPTILDAEPGIEQPIDIFLRETLVAVQDVDVNESVRPLACYLNYAQIRRGRRRWSCGGSGSRVNTVI